MAFRSQKIAGALLALLAWPALPAEFRYQARHDHLRKSGAGTLVIDAEGIWFRETGKHKDHSWQWPYQEIQQLELGPATLRILTYEDNKWKLGADRRYRFHLTGQTNFLDAYRFLRDKLDQRFVAALADPDLQPLWQIPVKHGVLLASEDRLVFRSAQPGHSRTFRYSDLATLSSTDPFQLTLTPHGRLRPVNFQLQQPLTETRYNWLWQKIAQPELPHLFSTKGNSNHD